MPIDKFTDPVSYYDVLQISPRSGDDEIKRAYRRLAMVYHPDLNPQNRSVAELRFRLINEAYAHLKTREKRALYKNRLKTHDAPGNGAGNTAGNDNRAQMSWFEHLASLFRPQFPPQGGKKNPGSKT